MSYTKNLWKSLNRGAAHVMWCPSIRPWSPFVLLLQVELPSHWQWPVMAGFQSCQLHWLSRRTWFDSNTQIILFKNMESQHNHKGLYCIDIDDDYDSIKTSIMTTMMRILTRILMLERFFFTYGIPSAAFTNPASHSHSDLRGNPVDTCQGIVLQSTIASNNLSMHGCYESNMWLVQNMPQNTLHPPW